MKFNHKHEWKESETKNHALYVFFMNLASTKTFNKKMDIYTIKHLYESWAVACKLGTHEELYVYSDEFIYHAQANGFRFKLKKVGIYGDPIGFINASQYDLRRMAKAKRKGKNQGSDIMNYNQFANQEGYEYIIT